MPVKEEEEPPTSPLYYRNVHKTRFEHLTQTYVLPHIKLKI